MVFKGATRSLGKQEERVVARSKKMPTQFPQRVGWAEEDQ
jgi:hypothetical protein